MEVVNMIHKTANLKCKGDDCPHSCCFDGNGLCCQCTQQPDHYDYNKQAWVKGGRYVRCGHGAPCDCYGRSHEGEKAS